LHEVFAAGSADAAAAAGFALGLAAGAAEGLPLLWVRQDFIDGEAGWLSGQGLAAFGLDPARLVTVRARNAADMLRALAEGGRCAALGAAIGEVWGEAAALDLTATRRLSLAARGSGVTLILLRLAAEPRPSAAETRWSARAAPSRPLEANAPGPPAFSVTLLRHRAGLPGRTLTLEWDRDRRIFRTPQPRRSLVQPLSVPPLPIPPLSGAVAALPAGRPLEAGKAFRRAG
jgi:protein ImuA